MLASHTTSALLHLRHVNPMLDVLAHPRSSGEHAMAANRQESPAARCCGTFAACSVSSFAYQGTNAHAIVASIGGHSGSRPTHLWQWQQRRFWVHPQLHLLVARSTRAGKTTVTTTVECSLSTPGSSVLWEHQVQGMAVVPGTAMLEAAFAAGVALASPSSSISVGPAPFLKAIFMVSILAPLILPISKYNEQHAILSTALDLRSGQVALRSLRKSLPGQTHLTGVFASHCTMDVGTRTAQLGSYLATAHSPLHAAASWRTVPTRAYSSAATSIAAVRQQHRRPAHLHHVDPIVSDNATQVMTQAGRLSMRCHPCESDCSTVMQANCSALACFRLYLLSGCRRMWRTLVCLPHWTCSL